MTISKAEPQPRITILLTRQVSIRVTEIHSHVYLVSLWVSSYLNCYKSGLRQAREQASLSLDLARFPIGIVYFHNYDITASTMWEIRLYLYVRVVMLDLCLTATYGSVVAYKNARFFTTTEQCPCLSHGECERSRSPSPSVAARVCGWIKVVLQVVRNLGFDENVVQTIISLRKRVWVSGCPTSPHLTFM